MKNGRKDKTKDKFQVVEGNGKRNIGHTTDRFDLEAKSRAERFSGTIREKLGELEALLGR